MKNRFTMQPRKHEGTKNRKTFSFSYFRLFVVAFVLVVVVARADGQDLSVLPIARDGQVLISFKLSDGLT